MEYSRVSEANRAPVVNTLLPAVPRRSKSSLLPQSLGKGRLLLPLAEEKMGRNKMALQWPGKDSLLSLLLMSTSLSSHEEHSYTMGGSHPGPMVQD